MRIYKCHVNANFALHDHVEDDVNSKCLWTFREVYLRVRMRYWQIYAIPYYPYMSEASGTLRSLPTWLEAGTELRVSMGLTVNRQMGQKLTANRQKRNIFTVNRQMSEQKLAVKFLRYP